MKVLFIAPAFPIPAHSGATIASLQTIASIQSRCDLHLLVPPPESEREHQALFRQLLPDVTLHFYKPNKAQATRLTIYKTAAKSLLKHESYWSLIWVNPMLRNSVNQLAAQVGFDVVHCEWLQAAVSLRGLDLPTVIRTLDVHFVGMRDWVERLPAGGLRKSYWGMQAKGFRQFEVDTLNSARSVITVSNEDEAILRSVGVSNVVTIPPPRHVEASSAPFEYGNVCMALFTGRLDMTVNRDAFFMFADQVWPHISADSKTRMKLVFAGGFPDDQLRRRASECGIEIQGSISDQESRGLLEQADIFVSPVFSGTGIKIKTLEAMAHGKPIVGFPGTFRGVPVENNKHALIANSYADFAHLLERLVYDPDLRRRISREAREFIRVNFDPDRLGEQLVGIYSEISTDKGSSGTVHG